MEDFNYEYGFYTKSYNSQHVFYHEDNHRRRLQQFLYGLYENGYFNIEDIIIAGDTDEIPKPGTISLLKHCELKDPSLHK